VRQRERETERERERQRERQRSTSIECHRHSDDNWKDRQLSLGRINLSIVEHGDEHHNSWDKSTKDLIEVDRDPSQRGVSNRNIQSKDDAQEEDRPSGRSVQLLGLLTPIKI
jgi:hypothetical protein